MNSMGLNDGESMGPHTVMVTMPLLSHIYPLLHFAKSLVAHHRLTVTFVNNRYYHNLLLSQEAPSAPYDSCCHGKLCFEWVENGFPLDHNFIDIVPSLQDFVQSCINMQAPLKALMESLNQKSPPVSCVVFGSFFTWAHHAAVELNIPTIFFWTQSAAVFSIYHHIHLFVANGFFPYKKTLPGNMMEYSHASSKCIFCIKILTESKKEDTAFVSYVRGVPPLRPADLPSFLHVEDTSHPNFKMMKQQFDLLKQCKAVIINSFHELEKEEIKALQEESFSVFVVGPLLSLMQVHNSTSDVANECSLGESLLEVETNACLRWLDKQRKQSVLYISFGTLTNPAAEDMEGIALALKESQQLFIWVIRPISCYNSTLGMATAFTSISEILPENFLEDTKDYGLVVPWAPQQQVLAHTSTGAFLTHCGWNSTLESVSFGVPMIPLPRGSDQTTNCKYVVDIWKVGMRLGFNENGRVDYLEVMRVLKVIFQEKEGQDMRRRVEKLREAARRAVKISYGATTADMYNFFQAMSVQSIKVRI